MQGKLSALKAKKPRSAGESFQLVEEIVDTEHADDFDPSPLKRRFEEVDTDFVQVKVKTERSMSSGSSFSGSTNASSLPTVKMELDPPHAVDEETSKAASILNGVAKDRRPVFPSGSAKLTLD